jgi:hypothetical protein
LLNNDVDPIVRRARSKLSMRWRYAEVLYDDGFAVLDRERPDVDSKLGDNGSDWFDVSGDASANVTRFRLLRSVRRPASTTARLAASPTRGASRSYCSGLRRPRWRASRRPSGASCALPPRPD